MKKIGWVIFFSFVLCLEAAESDIEKRLGESKSLHALDSKLPPSGRKPNEKKDQKITGVIKGKGGKKTGSTTLKTLNVKDFGALGDGAANDTAAIQLAINKAAVIPGSEVYFPAGTYTISFNHKRMDSVQPHALLLPSNTTLRGEGDASVIRMTFPERTFIADDGVDVGFTTILTTKGNILNENITIRNLVFEGSLVPLDLNHPQFERFNGLFFAQVKNVLIEKNTFRNIEGNVIYVHVGSIANIPDNIQVRENKFFDIDTRRILGMAILFQYAKNAVAESNLLVNVARGIGFETHYSEGPPMSNIRIAKNTLRGCGAPIELAGDTKGLQENMVVEENFIDNSESTLSPTIQGGIVVSLTNKVTIQNNTLLGGSVVGDSAIWARSSDDLVIKNNVIKGFRPSQSVSGAIVVHSDASGGSMSPSRNLLIENNALIDNQMTAIILKSVENGTIRKNTIKNNVGLVEQFGAGVGSGIALYRLTTGVLVQENLFEGNSYGALVSDGATGNVFKKNIIRSNLNGGVWVASEAGSGNQWGTAASGLNCISLNQVFDFRNDTPPSISAQGNYWGCSTGPQGTGPSTSGCAYLMGLATFQPVQNNCSVSLPYLPKIKDRNKGANINFLQ